MIPTEMRKEKRSIISPERVRELNQAELYVITCGIKGCTCEQKDDTCERGFFSLFIQAVYGIDFAVRNGISYHVDFGNMRYCYSDRRQDDANWWNYYFRQPTTKRPALLPSVVNRFHELYPLLIWDRSHFRRMNRYVQRLVFQEDVAKHIDSAREKLVNCNALGVHVRRTDHPDSVQPVEPDDYYRSIDKLIDRHDVLFLSTDDERIVSGFRKRYGTKVHVNDVKRSADAQAVHRNFENNHRWRLGLDVLTDCLCLASCKKLVLTFSNVSYAALLFNPEVPYILLEKPRTTWRRYKTLIVYFLDKWGIRKW